MTVSVAVIVPTRNRADLAIAAVQSLLAIDASRLAHVIVSNNSSEPGDERGLADFCKKSTDPRLIHLRPSMSLAMADHWDWAIQQSMARCDATHFALHYDRRISRREFPLLFDLAEQWPEVPITYLLDLVYPAPVRFRASLMPWTGGTYEIRTARLLELMARELVPDLWPCVPALANCLTPRAVFERIRDRFGNVCASTTPETAFAVRFCAIADTFVHFDRALAVHYGVARSNGVAYMRGDTSGTFGDFMAMWGDRPWLEAAPIPGLNIGHNTFYHEYALLRRTDEERFPPIEMEGYLASLARGLYWIDDPAHRAKMRDVLVKHGWTGGEAAIASVPRHGSTVRRRVRTLLDRLEQLRVDYVRTGAGDIARAGLKSEAKALRLALDYSPPASPDDSFLPALRPVRLQ